MTKKVFILIAFLIGLSTSINAQTNTDPEKVTYKQVLLEGSVLKLMANEMDLPNFEVKPDKSSNTCSPEIIMPTSHANEYALIDFSDCPNGIYWIVGILNNEVEKIKIIIAQ
jgi:hypothetical protein